jgi:cyclopropane-fatty-acyl-phospholipid synthase
MFLDPQTIFLNILDCTLNDAVVRFRVGTQELAAGKLNGQQGCEFSIRVQRKRFFSRVLCYGNLGLGESFMDGDFELESGRLCDFLTALLRNRIDEVIRRSAPLTLQVAAIRLRNMLRTRTMNVQRHYDIGNDLFESFLDPTLTYSCGYAHAPEESLENLQLNKLHRICAKLRLSPRTTLLDIGGGFGGLLIFAAEHYGITGMGITISPAQCERGNAEIHRRGLSQLIKLEMQEYRRLHGRYDRVVSVGMLEHVPEREYQTYFQKIAEILNPGGVGLVHAICCTSKSNQHDPFIQKYIFPGSSQPRLSQIANAMEKEGLAILDVENIIRHYAYTISGWLKRFEANYATLDSKRYDAIFKKMWEYYFACAIAAARASDAAVYQVLFNNQRTAEIPLHRV